MALDRSRASLRTVERAAPARRGGTSLEARTLMQRIALVLSISLLNACAANVAYRGDSDRSDVGCAPVESCTGGGRGDPLVVSIGVAAVIALVGAGTLIYRLVRDPHPRQSRLYRH